MSRRTPVGSQELMVCIAMAVGIIPAALALGYLASTSAVFDASASRVAVNILATYLAIAAPSAVIVVRWRAMSALAMMAIGASALAIPFLASNTFAWMAAGGPRRGFGPLFYNVGPLLLLLALLGAVSGLVSAALFYALHRHCPRKQRRADQR